MSSSYEALVIEVLGTVAAFTQANGCGDTLDVTFPAGTKFSDLTCS